MVKNRYLVYIILLLLILILGYIIVQSDNTIYSSDHEKLPLRQIDQDFVQKYGSITNAEEQENFKIEFQEVLDEEVASGSQQSLKKNPRKIQEKKFEVNKDDIISMVVSQQDEPRTQNQWIVIENGNDGQLGKIKTISSTGDEKSVINKIFEQENVQIVEPNYEYELQDVEYTDPLIGNQWSISINQLDKVWQKNKGEGVIVAVIDTAIDIGHEDLKDNLWKPELGICYDWKGDLINGGCSKGGYDIVNNDDNPGVDDGMKHGSHVAGIIGALGNNGKGVIGIAPNVQIMALRACDANNSRSGKCVFNVDNIVKSIYFATNNGAKLINASFGGTAFSYAMEQAITYARNKGVLFVSAGGNSATNNDITHIYPANYDIDNIISVGATDIDGNYARFSNYGKNSIDIAGPGVDIFSTIPGSYEKMNGTSMATPHVAGAGALLLASNSGFNFMDVKDRIFWGAEIHENLKEKVIDGKGLNIYRSMVADAVPLIDYVDIFDVNGSVLSGLTVGQVINVTRSLRDGLGLGSGDFNYHIQLEDSHNTMIIDEVTKDFFRYISFDKVGEYYLKIWGENFMGISGNKKIFKITVSDLLEVEKGVDLNAVEQLKRFVSSDLKLVRKESDGFNIDQEIQSLGSYRFPNYNTVNSDDSISRFQLKSDKVIIIDQKISKLVADLDYDPVKIYDYVRENIRFIPYLGSRKNSVECLESKACNDVDSAGLLIAMYRSAGILARYSEGIAEIDKSLLTDIMNAGSEQQAIDILTKLHRGEVEMLDDSVKIKLVVANVYLGEGLIPGNPMIRGEDENEIFDFYKSNHSTGLYDWRILFPFDSGYEFKKNPIITDLRNNDEQLLLEEYMKAGNEYSLSEFLQIRYPNILSNMRSMINMRGLIPIKTVLKSFIHKSSYDVLVDDQKLFVKIGLKDLSGNSLIGVGLFTDIYDESSGFDLTYLVKDALFYPQISYLSQKEVSSSGFTSGDFIELSVKTTVGNTLVYDDSKTIKVGEQAGVYMWFDYVGKKYSDEFNLGIEGYDSIGREFAIKTQEQLNLMGKILGDDLIMDGGAVYFEEIRDNYGLLTGFRLSSNSDIGVLSRYGDNHSFDSLYDLHIITNQSLLMRRYLNINTIDPLNYIKYKHLKDPNFKNLIGDVDDTYNLGFTISSIRDYKELVKQYLNGTGVNILEDYEINYPLSGINLGYWKHYYNTGVGDYGIVMSYFAPSLFEPSFIGQITIKNLQDYFENYEEILDNGKNRYETIGLPINNPIKYKFGTVDHLIRIMSNGIHFKGVEAGLQIYYEHKTFDNIKNMIIERLNTEADNDFFRIKDQHISFEFDNKIGTIYGIDDTYLDSINAVKGQITNNYIRFAYAIPDNYGGVGLIDYDTHAYLNNIRYEDNTSYETYNRLWSLGFGRKSEFANHVLISSSPRSYLGFPTSNSKDVELYHVNSVYQEFIGGKLFRLIGYDNIFRLNYGNHFLLGALGKYFDFEKYGYPETDLIVYNDDNPNKLWQYFNNGFLNSWDVKTLELVENDTLTFKYDCKLGDNATNEDQYMLYIAYLHGVTDVLGTQFSDTITMVLHPVETYNDIRLLINNIDALSESIKDLLGSYYDEIIDKDSCSLRRSYLLGRSVIVLIQSGELAKGTYKLTSKGVVKVKTLINIGKKGVGVAIVNLAKKVVNLKKISELSNNFNISYLDVPKIINNINKLSMKYNIDIEWLVHVLNGVWEKKGVFKGLHSIDGLRELPSFDFNSFYIIDKNGIRIDINKSNFENVINSFGSNEPIQIYINNAVKSFFPRSWDKEKIAKTMSIAYRNFISDLEDNNIIPNYLNDNIIKDWVFNPDPKINDLIATDILNRFHNISGYGMVYWSDFMKWKIVPNKPEFGKYITYKDGTGGEVYYAPDRITYNIEGIDVSLFGKYFLNTKEIDYTPKTFFPKINWFN